MENKVLIEPSESLLSSIAEARLYELPKEMQKTIEKLLGNETKLVPFDFLKSLYFSIFKTDDKTGHRKVYLHEWLEGSKIHYPKPVIPPRNPELEARIQKLKAEQEQRQYNKMTANVASHSEPGYVSSVAEEVREVRAQIFAVMNFVLTVGGTFAFGYKLVEYSQVLVGMVFATIVAVAELYFLIQVI